jgi:hypothetical protein
MRPSPSLKQLSSEALKSRISREIMESLKHTPDSMDTIAIIADIEKAHLDAVGRIPDDSMPNFLATGQSLVNWGLTKQSEREKSGKRNHQEIDGARLASYDEETHSFQIRIDDTERPTFWCHVTLNMESLQTWLLDQGIEMTFKTSSSESI